MNASDYLELFVGEIGIHRREFLYDITYAEALRIVRGYRRRGRLEQQLLRLTAYMSCFSMHENKMHQTPGQWLPLPWEGDDEDNDEPPISEEERQELVDLMASINAAPPTNSKSDEQ